MSEEVLVFKSELLRVLPKKEFVRDIKILPFLLSNAEFVERDSAEQDISRKQFITYSIIRFGDHVFSYKRTKRGKESRLHDKYSIGVGGHVNKDDNFFGIFADARSILDWSRDRELQEEFKKSPKEFDDTFKSPEHIGFINDDSDDVGKVHFGIVYEYFVKNSDVVRNRLEQTKHIEHRFISIDELVQRIDDFENWSKIMIRNYLMTDQFSNKTQPHSSEQLGLWD